MIQLLQEYLRINTSHPNPDYQAVGVLFAQHAQRDGLAFQEIMLPSGFPVFCISLAGSDASLPAVALNHHMDVVSADAQEWAHDPFGGIIKDGIIFGRGAQDCKSVGVAHYAALVHMRKQGGIKRTVHMLLVPHEEVGGFLGVGQLIHTEQFKKLNIELVLDEGLPSGIPNTLFIKVSERKPLQIKLIARNSAGHAARTNAPNAVHDLLEAIVLCKSIVAKLNTREHISSCSVTSLCAGSEHAHNVIPGTAQATLDIRVAAQHSIADLERTLLQAVVIYPTLSVEICARVPDVPLQNFEKSVVYQVMCRRIKQQGAQPVPLHFEASSDLRWYQALGIEGYGFTPFTCVPNLHGVNESIPVDDFEKGITVMIDILQELERV